MAQGFAATASGVITAGFDEAEAAVVSSLAERALAVLVGEAHDETTRRALLPTTVSPGADPFTAMTQGLEVEQAVTDLKAGALTALVQGLPAGGGCVSLDLAAAELWLQGLSAVRLTLAARLGLSTSQDVQALDEDLEAALDPALDSAIDDRLYAAMLYHWLGWLQSSLVAALDLLDAAA